MRSKKGAVSHGFIQPVGDSAFDIQESAESLVNLQGPVIILSFDEADEQRAGLIGLADFDLQRVIALG